MKILRIILYSGYLLQGVVMNLKFWKNIKNLAKWGQFFMSQKKPLNKVICKVRKRRTGTPLFVHIGDEISKNRGKKCILGFNGV
jgi:hypothetical protein